MKRHALLVTLVLLGGAGCLVESLPEEGGRLELSIGLPPGTRTPSTPVSPWDGQGLFHLEKFPKLVKVTVETKDYALASGTWPDPERGIGDGERPNGEVGIDLEVPAGPARRLRGLGFVVPLDQDEATVYREAKPLDLDLVAGRSTETVLQMVPHEIGTAELTVRCELGDGGPWVPVQAALVDGKAFVLHPPRLLAKGNEVGSLKVSFRRVPAGRPHWVRVIVAKGSQLLALEQRQPSFSLSAGETRPVDVTLPCQDLPR